MEDSVRMSSETRSKKDKSSELPSLIPSLPDDIVLDILARLRRCYYPKLSLVSRHFRSLVASHELYARRSLLGCTEHCLYVVLHNRVNHTCLLYVLRRKANGNHSLVLVPSLPNMPREGGFVAVGSRIYVFGRSSSYRHMKVPPNAISIDCRSQIVHLLPSMNVTMSVSVADVIDGKIYVTGCCNTYSTKMVVTVFNTETQMWEPKMSGYVWPGNCVVMAGKMYMRTNYYGLLYQPKESKWETKEKLNYLKCKDACVIDDILYYYDCFYDVLRAYNRKESRWVRVNGLEEFLAEKKYSHWLYTGSYDGKIVLYHKGYKKGILCAEISLERRQGMEIWGKVEWCDSILIGGDFHVIKSLDVIV